MSAKLIAAVVGALITASATWWFLSPDTPEKRKSRYGNTFPALPGGRPVLGHLHLVVTSDYSLLREAEKQVGKIFNVSIFGLKVLYFSAVEHRKQLLGKLDGKSIGAGWPPRWQALLGAGSVSVAPNDQHSRLRRLVAKGVNKAAISFYYESLRANARKIIGQIAEVTSGGKRVASLVPFLKTFTYNAIAGFIAGAVPQHEAVLLGLRRDFFLWSDGLGDLFIPAWLPFSPFAKAMKARARIAKAVEGVITERKAGVVKGLTYNDALGYLVAGRDEDGSELTVEEITDNFISLAFAGFDTTAGTICSSIHCLLHEISAAELDLLRNEILSLSEPIQESTLTSLPVLDSFVKEVLRKYAPVAAVFKVATEDFEIDGVTIKKGTTLDVPMLASHMNPDHFDDPESFRLSRFLVDEVDKKRPFDFLPFSTGVRMCLGMQLARLEMKIFVLEMLRGFNFAKGVGKPRHQLFPVNLMEAPVVVTRL
ncbi:hypothetical protein HK101_005228 [Irineochytrium annulatum]|nr:hypothetical protein HK101_005228 [Irineochytrium annulatum]